MSRKVLRVGVFSLLAAVLLCGCTGEQEIEEVFSVGGYLRTAFGNYKEQQQKCAADQCSEKDNFIAG